MVVGVCSDIEVFNAKGPTVFNSEERAYMIKECKWVNEVVIDAPYTPTVDLLDSYNCQFYAHGDDIAIDANGNDACHFLKEAGRYREFK